jgi:DNA-binding GntR family transcriptional regulator
MSRALPSAALPPHPATTGGTVAELVPGGAVGRVVAAIRQRLFDGQYVPGQRLVEADLMIELDVGRGTVREALQRLASDGLVDLVRNRGAVVHRLSRREVEEQFAIREMLEGLAAATAARRVDVAGNRTLFEREWRAQQESARQAGTGEYFRLNLDFHSAIMAMAGNRQLRRMLDHLHIRLFSLQFKGALGTSDRDTSFADHRRIAQAIMTGNAAAAQRAMRRHVRNSRLVIVGQPDTAFRPED